MNDPRRPVSPAGITRMDVGLALAGLAGPIVFELTDIAASLLRQGYSPVDRAISDLGIGEKSWLLTVSLVVLGLSLVALAVSFYRAIRPPAKPWLRILAAVLLASVGVGYGIAGVIPETNPLHWMIGAPLVYFGSILGFFLAGLLLRRDPAWRAWGRVSLAASLLTIALVGATFFTFSSYKFTPQGLYLAGHFGGLMERLLFLEILTWYAASGYMLFRASRFR
jgi:hypothetical membrane protein